MYCRHCGKQIPEDSEFCPGCGKPTDLEPQEPVKPDSSRQVWVMLASALGFVLIVICLIWILGAVTGVQKSNTQESESVEEQTSENVYDTLGALD